MNPGPLDERKTRARAARVHAERPSVRDLPSVAMQLVRGAMESA